jgi:DNA-directed RNA polymerase specialized sigma24 family protein
MDTHQSHLGTDNPSNLLRLAWSTATRILRNPIQAEEAGERAVHKLFLLCLAGRGPAVPEAWVRVAARRIAQSMSRRRTRRVTLDLDQLPGPRTMAPEPVDTELLLVRLQPLLTERQRQAVEAALASRTMRAAARQCRMTPKDLRRSLELVGEKGRANLGAWRSGDDAVGGRGRSGC